MDIELICKDEFTEESFAVVCEICRRMGWGFVKSPHFGGETFEIRYDTKDMEIIDFIFNSL